MRWLLGGLGTLIGLAILVLIVGAALPESHIATVHVRLDAPPESVFAAISDPGTAMEWRSDVTGVDIRSQPGEPLRWRETTRDGTIAFRAEDSRSPDRFVARIEPGLPFGGRWIHELAPDGPGTLLTITEEGEVYNPLFRFVSRFILGHHASLERYGQDLVNRFGSDAGVQRADPADGS